MYIYKNVEMNERAYHIYIFFLLVLLKLSEYKKICILCSQFPLVYFITRSPLNSDFLIFNDIIRLKWQLWGDLPPNHPQHVSGAGVQNRHLRHRRCACVPTQPWTSSGPPAIISSPATGISSYISSFKDEETAEERKTKKVLLDQRVHEGLTLTCCLVRRGH